MKIYILALSILVCLEVCASETSKNDFTAKLGDEGAGSEVAESIRLLPPPEQDKVLQSIVDRVREIGRQPQPWTSATILYVSNAAALLSKCGRDEMIVSAFDDLSQFGNSERDAAFALAACRGGEGVKIIEKQARMRLAGLERAVNPQNDADAKQSNALLLPFFSLIKELANSANPLGLIAATRIRDDFAKLYDSQNGKIVLASIDSELVKVAPRKLINGTVTDRVRGENSQKLSVTENLARPDKRNNRGDGGTDIPVISKQSSRYMILMIWGVGLLIFAYLMSRLFRYRK